MMIKRNTTVFRDTLLVRTNDENKEGITLLWYDPNIESHHDTERTKQQLRSINDFVLFHTDLDQCVKFIQSIEKEKIFLITSGSKAKEFLPLISHLRQVDSIFIFCVKKDKYQHLIDKYSKIVGIYSCLDELCSSIRQEINLCNKQLEAFRIFDHHQQLTKDLLKQSGEFLWLQLFHYIIIRLPRDQPAKKQMIDICRDYYRGNSDELKSIDKFEREYRPEDAIHWYSKQSFIYRMINKALRTEDLDQLQTFRFFIGDLSQSLSYEHQKILSSDETILTVYRGTKLNEDEFEKLKENQGKIITTNGYLSTSRHRQSAINFLMKPTKRTGVIPLLFQIQCHIQHIGKSIIYADIAKFSDYPDEEEVLFDLNAAFRLDSIEKEGYIQVIKMTLSNEGEKITRNYIELTQKETEEMSVAIVFGRLMYNLGQYEKSQKYFQELLNNPNGEDIPWIQYNIGRVLQFKGQWNEAREYYQQAYHRMIDSIPPRIKDAAHVINSIGIMLYQHGKYNQALDYHQQVLKIYDKLYPAGHVDVTRTLNNIGCILNDQGNYDQALDYHHRALEMREKCYPFGHVDIARTLNSIAVVFKNQGKYDQALDYHQRSLRIREKFYPFDHVDIAHSLNNIGTIFKDQGKYDEALEYYERSLKIREKFYQFSHVDIGRSLDNIGLCYEHNNQKNMAMDYYQRALTIYDKFLPLEHPYRVKTVCNIHRISEKAETI
ncbi:unnamed protein product [Rotaria sordida]|uniref:ADP ribosyltransferase domain-containing protein n=1 Tax=Rotaria sordida TaxID=392033 RepID=A0A818VUD1_9BILA|nr:unnamed protein product [Rotaria sordida]CAF1073715.1 unnamed protein product [Rotaria sordida]CAF3599988.1 unnamed protein product [Rotaria sordida]CAF3716262.1 unnamed protein product [Rotaria sordida]